MINKRVLVSVFVLGIVVTLAGEGTIMKFKRGKKLNVILNPFY
ncbi:hypothetical protein [Methanosarcina sp.]|nr:hypothetical protein [Methanosarcina sp.]MDW5549316.1 hypothetical protein [Methanosarcina sp.]MDW5553493.1 hypothetical protein [Methanosarcina sp.]MDW5559818.1 hypothetical protein [Methanosarcina sp.]